MLDRIGNPARSRIGRAEASDEPDLHTTLHYKETGLAGWLVGGGFGDSSGEEGIYMFKLIVRIY